MAVRRVLDKNPLSWLNLNSGTWRIDLDKLKAEIVSLKPLDWLTGIVDINPYFEQEPQTTFGETTNHVSLAFYFTPDSLCDARPLMSCPPEIRESLKDFRKDHPDPRKAVFVMMPFDKSKRYKQIIETVITVWQNIVFQPFEQMPSITTTFYYTMFSHTFGVVDQVWPSSSA